MYKSRNIRFREVVLMDNWRIKTYTISEHAKFKAEASYQNALFKLPTWLGQLNSFDPSHEHIAFLILHEGNEGVFSLISTWVGNNMLQSHVYISKYNDLNNFQLISGDGLFACVWELEIINHERNAWIEHILKKDENRDYNTYLQDILNTTV